MSFYQQEKIKTIIKQFKTKYDKSNFLHSKLFETKKKLRQPNKLMC